MIVVASCCRLMAEKPSPWLFGLSHCRRLTGYRQTGQVSAPTPQAAPAVALRPVPAPHADQAAEIARLRREAERLRMERDILKKRIANFAKPSR